MSFRARTQGCGARLQDRASGRTGIRQNRILRRRGMAEGARTNESTKENLGLSVTPPRSVPSPARWLLPDECRRAAAEFSDCTRANVEALWERGSDNALIAVTRGMCNPLADLLMGRLQKNWTESTNYVH